jgi:hypothetical protein
VPYSRSSAASNGAAALFVGHWTAEHYQAERECLEALRDELKAAAPAPAIELRGLLDTWDSGDHVARRELLAAMFDCLCV